MAERSLRTPILNKLRELLQANDVFDNAGFLIGDDGTGHPSNFDTIVVLHIESRTPIKEETGGSNVWVWNYPGYISIEVIGPQSLSLDENRVRKIQIIETAANLSDAAVETLNDNPRLGNLTSSDGTRKVRNTDFSVPEYGNTDATNTLMSRVRIEFSVETQEPKKKAS